MIPNTIHQIWIGPKPAPLDWINTWKYKGIEHVLWDDSAIKNLKMINKDKFDYYIDREIYFGAADVLRTEILYQYGGVYIDADIECLKPIPKELFSLDFFAVYAPDNPKKWTNRISNAVIACSKNNNIIKKYIEQISLAEKLTPVTYTIGGSLLTNVINQFNNSDFSILPYTTFYPKSKWSNDDPIKSGSIGNHHWGSTRKIY